MQKVRNLVDAEMGLLVPVGPQGLFSEDWSKDRINDNRMFRADGNWSNASGKYSQGECKNICESIFGKGEEKDLRNSCKSKCDSKCTWTKCEGGYKPTRESICLERGLNADCTEKGSTPAIDPVAAATAAAEASSKSRAQGTKKGMSTGAKVGIVVGVLAVAGLGFWYFKTRK